MHKINIGLTDDARTVTINALKQYLTDSMALALKTQGFHWNVEGPHFGPLHALFQTQYEDLFAANDETAERIRMMGEYAPSSLAHFHQAATIEQAPEAAVKDTEMISELCKDHERLCRNLREAIPLVQKGGDEGTADYFIARLQQHEKTAWMLRSHVVAQ